jgi:hypothetical protein
MPRSDLMTSDRRYLRRPPANCQAARIAWDILTRNGERPIVSMRLLDGLWMCKLTDGSLDEVEAGWVTNMTPRVLRRLSAGADRRARQGRA